MMPFPKAGDRQTKPSQDCQMRELFVIVGSYLGKQSNIYIIVFVSRGRRREEIVGFVKQLRIENDFGESGKSLAW
jgi:hypothetical protein